MLSGRCLHFNDSGWQLNFIRVLLQFKPHCSAVPTLPLRPPFIPSLFWPSILLNFIMLCSEKMILFVDLELV